MNQSLPNIVASVYISSPQEHGFLFLINLGDDEYYDETLLFLLLDIVQNNLSYSYDRQIIEIPHREGYRSRL